MRYVVILLIIAVTAVPAICSEVKVEAEKTVSLEAKDQAVGEILKQIAKETGSTILAEKLVTGEISISLKDATVEKALGLVAKAGDWQWMKVYVPGGSVYAKDGDALAVQVRLLLGLKFPDIVIAPSASYAPVVHLQKDQTASGVLKNLGKDSGLVTVYLVTNDKEYTKKLTKKEAKDKAKKYAELSKESMELFLAMTPEERAEAMKQGMQMAMQLGPEAMLDMMNTVMQIDPEYMTEINSKAMQAIMNMDSAARKNFLRTSMRSQFQMIKNMNPEQMQQFQREAAEIAKELIESGQMPMPPGTTPGQ